MLTCYMRIMKSPYAIHASYACLRLCARLCMCGRLRGVFNYISHAVKCQIEKCPPACLSLLHIDTDTQLTAVLIVGSR